MNVDVNLVSGLILLFERPIRAGDVVTVADVSGVVSRIRMRATTITNWDRKEFIVPNSVSCYRPNPGIPLEYPTNFS